MSVKAIPFFPNRCIEYLPDSELNWFLFGKRIYDREHKLYFIQIANPLQFITISDGKTYRPVDSLKLIEGGKFESAVNMGYDGIATMTGGKIQCSPLSLCKQVEYQILKDKIEIIDDHNKCRLIKEAKSRNSYIRENHPDFPTCQQIDSIIKSHGCVDPLAFNILKNI